MLECPSDILCSKKDTDPNFKFWLNENHSGNFKNWLSELDLMCENRTSLASVSSCYFLGFGLGLLLMFYPDSLGRKKTMTLVMVPYIIFTQLTIFSPSLTGKKIGYFMQGLLHLKITLSYTHMFELTDEASKDFCATVINMTDSLTLFIMGFCLKYV